MCLDLIQKHPHGLLPLLDQQIMLKRKTNDRQLLGIFDQVYTFKSYIFYLNTSSIISININRTINLDSIRMNS